MDRLSDILSKKNGPVSNTSTASNSENEITSHVAVSPEAAVPEHNENLRAMIINMKKDLDQMLRILDGVVSVQIPVHAEKPETETPPTKSEQIIEGVFNGQKMIDGDGNTYDVPANYASKSKLVEGDMMKLTIGKQGNYTYKQIGPIDRQRVRGVLYLSEDDSQWSIITAAGKSYKILTASVTFYKGKAKDEVIAFIPQNGHSEWAAVEHIISI